jgi:hypothetical protein
MRPRTPSPSIVRSSSIWAPSPKGLAIDLAVRELRGFPGCAVDAGGDVYAGGRNAKAVAVVDRHSGIQSRRRAPVTSIRVSNAAVCTTSGRGAARAQWRGHHVFDPRRRSPQPPPVPTVVAATAMVADAFATAAFVLGPVEGTCLSRAASVDGVIFSPAWTDSRRRRSAGTMQRFFRTPKGLLTLVLAALAATAAATREGVGDAVRILGAGIAPAMLIDATILWRRNGSWEFPSGALLTGALVSMVLSTAEPWHVAALSAVIGVVTKYIARTRSANIFNPAALGLVVTFFIFGTAQDWWGALPNLPFIAIVLLLAGGIFITTA